MTLEDLQKQIGYKTRDKGLYDLAFVHRSFVNESKDVNEHNERLEFLGDAVLELVSTTYLYDNFPDKLEGELTSWRAALVRKENLAAVAKELDFGSLLKLSRGEEKTGGRDKDYILANTLEAFIGALYLDQGYEKAKDFIDRHVLSRLDDILAAGLHIDAKSQLQEMAQEELGVTPVYELLADEGPDHDKTFLMGVKIGDDLAGQGKGSSKQAAEEEAARDALKKKSWL